MKIKIENKRIDYLFIGIISLLFLILILHDAGSWYYSVIGDEYAFFRFAKSIALGKEKFLIFKKPGYLSIFDQGGVYGFTPVANSIFQAFVMKIFGFNHAGWIMSSIIAVILSFVYLYLLTKELFNRRTAIYALLIYSSSHYLWAFSHIGYSHIQGIFPLLMSIYYFIRGIKKDNYFLIFVAGLSSGLCFYASHFSMISPLLIFLYFIFTKNWTKKIKTGLVFLAGFLLLFTPYILTNYQIFLEPVLKRSVLGSGEIPQGSRLGYFWKNIWRAFTAFFYNKKVSHFVSGSLIDPVSGVLLGLGFITLSLNWKKFKFIILKFLIILVMVGGFSQYTYIPITRLYFLLPTLSLIGAIGLDYFVTLISKYIPRKISFVLVVVLFISILGLNVYRFYWQTPQKIDLTSGALVMGAISENLTCREGALVFYDSSEILLESALESHGLNNGVFLFGKDKAISDEILSKSKCIILTGKNKKISNRVLGVQENWQRKYFHSFSKNNSVEIVIKLD